MCAGSHDSAHLSRKSNIPLVSVVCLCYNHAAFVAEAIDSVLQQTYTHIQLIVVDDGSNDGSQEVIKELQSAEGFQFIALQENKGNTRAFNIGLEQCRGKYVIDLAADDVLCRDRLEKQVAFFEKQPGNVGVLYSDAWYIDIEGKKKYRHSERCGQPPYTGDVYARLVQYYFVSPPTMMMRKTVLDQLGGYDENLAYEDFDFWVRSSRSWHYAYQPEALTWIRITPGSLSSKAYQPDDKQLHSTFLVCEKIKTLNKLPSEDQALLRRLSYEIRHAVWSANFAEATLFIGLYRKLQPLTLSLRLLQLANRLRLDFSLLRKWYLGFAEKA